MKKNKFRTETEKRAILKEYSDGASVMELQKKYGLGNSSIYEWRKKLGGIPLRTAATILAKTNLPAKQSNKNGTDYLAQAKLLLQQAIGLLQQGIQYENRVRHVLARLED